MSQTQDVLPKSTDWPVRYAEIAPAILAVVEGETDQIAVMSSVVTELFHRDDRADWVGFYRNIGSETLKVGPYQGGHGCITIDFSQGVCGACARSGETQLVPDVEAFPGHIACSSTTQSEIVLPVFDKSAALLAVLDIDSNQPDAFDSTDQEALERLMHEIFAQS